MEKNTKQSGNVVREFIELISKSGLSLLDKEYFISRFFQDGGLTKEMENELIKALEESSDALRIIQVLENEEVKGELAKVFEETGFNEMVKELMDASVEYELCLKARDEAAQKHDSEANRIYEELLTKHGNDEDSPEFVQEYEKVLEKYRQEHEVAYRQLGSNVEEARKRMDEAEDAIQKLVEKIQKESGNQGEGA